MTALQRMHEKVERAVRIARGFLPNPDVVPPKTWSVALRQDEAELTNLLRDADTLLREETERLTRNMPGMPRPDGCEACGQRDTWPFFGLYASQFGNKPGTEVAWICGNPSCGETLTLAAK